MDLGSLNLDGIENIINSMSQKDIEDLSAMASQFFSGSNDAPKVKHEEKSEGIDLEAVTRIASVLSRLSSQPKDPGCELISALRPMLSPERRHKADEAIKMLQLFSLLPLLKDLQ
jgi:hypothetical protein